MNKKKFVFASIFASMTALAITACGDDVTKINEIHQDGMAVLEAGQKLSEQACDTANVGEMLFVMDSSEAFICDGKSWQTLKGEKGETGDAGKDGKDGANGTSCTVKPVKNKADLNGLEVTCGKTVVDTIWNGAAGKDGKPGDSGKDGSDGANGTNCTAKSVENDAGLKGFELTCGETVVGTIWNGKKGGDGETGKDGASCSLTDDGNGSVVVTCGEGDDETITNIYKAMCGTEPYDPAKSFCSDDELFSCDGKPYDPAKSFCSEDEAYDLCDGKTYDPKKQYCLKVTRGGTDIYSVEALLTDARDEEHVQVYKTVKICNDDETSCQTWMAENLNYSVNPGTQSWCGGGEAGTKNEGDCFVYGRLYTWAAAVGKSEDECGDGKTCNLPSGDIRGVCPEGWHLPSNVEWNALFTAVGDTSYAGQKLKADSDLWNEGTSNDDSFGFAVLPAGYRGDDGSFNDEGNVARFWSSTEDDSYNADYWYFFYDYDFVDHSWDIKYFGFSVRCLRD